MTTPVKVDVWSDIACPWCYIGKRKFEAGAAAAGTPVEIEYHSFELSPDTPVDFEGSEAEYLAGHKGLPVAQAQQMIDTVTGIAASVGLDYHYDTLHHTNTVKAHQLIQLAKTKGLQLEMVERTFAAYFVEGRHLGHDEDLVALAAEVGIDPEEARATLAGDTQLEAVRADQAEARRLGVNGVPFFVLDGKYGVSGAQDPATFAQVLEQVVALRDPDVDPAIDGGAADATAEATR